MSRDLVIGVDCSTTACKAVVWDMSGKAIAIGRHGYGLDHVRSGWVEQNAADWWVATSAAIAEAVKQVGGDRIAALAITHQRETAPQHGLVGQAVGEFRDAIETLALEGDKA